MKISLTAVAAIATAIPCNFSEAFVAPCQTNSFISNTVPSTNTKNHEIFTISQKYKKMRLSKLYSTTETEAGAPSEVSSDMKSSNGSEYVGNNEQGSLPELGKDGLYKILNKEQHLAFLEANPDQILVIKFYAPWCRACKGLEPKFLKVTNDERYKDLPLVFADFSLQGNKDYVKSLGVLALPNILIYAGSDGLVENFPCGPSKVPILKKKIAMVVNDRVDPDTYKLMTNGKRQAKEAEPCKERDVSATEGDIVSPERIESLRAIPYFKDFTDEEYEALIKTTKLQTFEPGSVIMKQGMKGNKFYVIDSGEVEIGIKTDFQDPLLTPPGYLGAVINILSKDDFFGERSLITGEPRAASIRAVEKTRCFAFDRNDIPESSVLSGKKSATEERIAEVNDKYGVDIIDMDQIGYDKQLADARLASQERGSIYDKNTGRRFDISEDMDLPASDSTATTTDDIEDDFSLKRGEVVGLLYRFRNICRAARCFEYISKTQPRLGDVAEQKRRAMLVSMLTPAQVEDFKATFEIIDKSQDNIVSLEEMRVFMNSVGTEKSDEELADMINKANPAIDGNSVIHFDEFLGVMAEAEFFDLFNETLNTLDKRKSGFVKAGDIDLLLGGMRDLISDDRKSLIDVEDKDMLVDYEEFSRMLLGVVPRQPSMN